MKKPWDAVLTPLIQHRVAERRIHPDGMPRVVGYTHSAGRRKMKYPWEKLEDGDFFIAPHTSSPEAQKRGIQQSAARNDMEIVIVPVEHRGKKCWRVTKIQENITLIRTTAHRLGIDVTLGFNTRKYNERINKWRRERKQFLRAEDSSIGHPESTDSEDA